MTHQYVDIAIPTYIKKQLQKYNHPAPAKPVHSPFPPPQTYGAKAQEPTPTDDSPSASDDSKKLVQQIVSGILNMVVAHTPQPYLAYQHLAVHNQKQPHKQSNMLSISSTISTPILMPQFIITPMT